MCKPPWTLGLRLDISLGFSSAFDDVNHKALFLKLGSVGISGSVLNISSDRHQRVSIDGYFSGFSRVSSGVLQGSSWASSFYFFYL